MKFTTLLLSALVLGTSVFAQYPGMMTTQVSSNPEGTALGANETLTASGIALGNRVKMRGYIDFILGYDDYDAPTAGDSFQDEQFNTSGDVDFLFDFSPLTAEAHIRFNADNNSSTTFGGPGKGVDLEQLFARYNVNDVFNFSFGRQLTPLGYESDESTGLNSVTTAYLADKIVKNLTGSSIQSRRNYVDGIRANFNNGQFGITFGIHDGYWHSDHFNGDDLALDIAASVMIIPGLEARLGYAHEEISGSDADPAADSDISQLNLWLGYNPNDLTLAIEYDNFDLDYFDNEYWSLMLLASYQFTDWFAATLRYTHEDYEETGTADHDADRFTFAFLFSITDNFGLNVEYSTADVDSATLGDYNEFYIEGLISY
jgi:hypothetical protein